MGRRTSARGGGGSTVWPGSSSQLTSGSGNVVTIGSGLSLSGGALAATASTGVGTTMWDVDWRTIGNNTFSTTQSTLTITPAGYPALPVTFALSLGSGATGTFSSDSTGLTMTHTGGSLQSAGIWWVDLTSLGLVACTGPMRVWTMWDSSQSGYSSSISGDEFMSGGSDSVAFTNVYGVIRGKGSPTAGLRTNVTNETGSVININGTTIVNYDVHVVELINGRMCIYAGASVAGAWPALSSCRVALPYQLGRLFYASGGNGFASVAGYAYGIMQLYSNTTAKCLRQKIEKL